MQIKEQIIQALEAIVSELASEKVEIELAVPSDPTHGDYTTNLAMKLYPVLSSKQQAWKTPLELAEEISTKLQTANLKGIEKIEAIKPGFINFYLSKEYLLEQLEFYSANDSGRARMTNSLAGKKIMVEYAHPNTHKEMHIGHMRTLITGEAISRLLESQGATVFRANYQGDIGPHVAKAMVGMRQIMLDKGLNLDQVSKWSSKEKAHFLGEGYALGSKLYEENPAKKTEIDSLNSFLYQRLLVGEKLEEDKSVSWDLYQLTRQWSLDYYAQFYTRFYTKFDRLFMESEMVSKGKTIVLANVGKVFTQDADGSIIFKGEQYGLHTRVFVTQAGNPTYEGKEMGNAFAEAAAFAFDQKIHVVASEQLAYFQVVFKALELIDRQKFANKQLHLSMGMVQLVDRKMSSRTGEVLTVDWLIEEVKQALGNLFKTEKELENKEDTIEKLTIGAIKYSVLKVSPKQDVAFSIDKSISLEGNSAIYIQYAYVRTQSILQKAKTAKNSLESWTFSGAKLNVNSLKSDEILLLRIISNFSELVSESAGNLAPNLLCNYLFTLAQKFNSFYQQQTIINSKEEKFRLVLVYVIGLVLKQGLELLGLAVVSKM